MRFLVVDHYYPEFVASIYDADPGLRQRTYLEQRAELDKALFGETVFETAALRALGHEASDALVNVVPLQAAWARDHGLHTAPAPQLEWRLRRRLVPWPHRTYGRWIGEALMAQVQLLRPDVLHVQCIALLPGSLVGELRKHVRLLVGQIAAPLPDDRVLANYDLVVSSLPNFVTRFRAAGLDSEWLPLAFEPSLVELVGQRDRDVPVSFVGSLSASHGARVALLEAIASAANVSVWTGSSHLNPGSPLQGRIRGQAWGRAMYEVLARSDVTLNNHIDIAAGFANNLRLFEATGMGAVLLTDGGSNLPDLFEIDKEVVSYSSVDDCVEKVRYLLEHPIEASSIGAAGQLRTLRDHNWQDRMRRLVDLVQRRL